MSTPSRRRFLQAAPAAVALGLAGRAAAIEPIVRTGPPRVKLSLAAYSYTKLLDLKRKPKPAMTLEEFITGAAQLPLEAVELTGYYFPETTPAYLAKLKGMCTRLGLDVSGTAVGNDFCTPDAEKLKTDLASVKRWAEHTARLGGKTMRVFAGSVAKGDTEEQARARCVAAMQEACDHAAGWGVYLALENHGGITATADQILAIVKAVKHDWFGVNLDTGNFRTPDPYADLAKLAPYAVVVQMKTEVQPAGKPKEPADLKRKFGILNDARYRGYVALEYEAADDPIEAVPREVKRLRSLVG